MTTTTILAPISVGELIDKITILEIKSKLLENPAALKNVHRELVELNNLADKIEFPNLAALKQELKQVNLELWHIENYKRKCEQNQKFDEEFIQAARQVYLKNDLRAQVKRGINLAAGSTIIEEKSHKTA